VAHDLLLAISKQESRFSPGVQSVAGARGMMQLMPATAEELAGRSLSDAELNDPSLNIRFGAQYLRQLMERWEGDPMLVIASYNAGPGAVSDWQPQALALDPELWVERIPYPETRYYTKKVLDNLLGYLERDRRFCEEGAGRIGQGRTESDS
jgi:soluble lytic murein transglycosylase